MTTPGNARRAVVALGAMLCAVTAAATIAGAAPEGDVRVFLDRVRTALEPAGPSIRTMEVRVSGPDGVAQPITVRQARTTVGGTRHVLTVVVAPVEAAGTAILLSQNRDAPEERWIFAPVVRRTRHVVPVLRHEPFLDSDFSLADLGFIDTRRIESFSFVPTPGGEGDGRLVGIQETPEDQAVYSRIVTWVDAERGVPQKREFYDRAGRLWKVERFEDVRALDGVATPMRLVMEDVQTGGRTEIRVTDVRRDVALPAELFDPQRLSAAARAEVWTGTAAAAGGAAAATPQSPSSGATPGKNRP
jgi:hypothetical protein